MMDDKYEKITMCLEDINITTKSMNQTKFEYEKIFEYNDKIKDDMSEHINKNTDEIKNYMQEIDKNTRNANLLNIQNSQKELIIKNDFNQENIIVEIGKIQSLSSQIKKISIDLKDDLTFEKIIMLNKENKE